MNTRGASLDTNWTTTPDQHPIARSHRLLIIALVAALSWALVAAIVWAAVVLAVWLWNTIVADPWGVLTVAGYAGGIVLMFALAWRRG